jgi:hypothetical protein
VGGVKQHLPSTIFLLLRCDCPTKQVLMMTAEQTSAHPSSSFLLCLITAQLRQRLFIVKE